MNTIISATIEMRPVSALKPWRRNARTHSKRQIRQIADSIRRFGFTNPVLISDDDEIIAGHGRVAAARELAIASVPTLRLSHLSALAPGRRSPDDDFNDHHYEVDAL